MWCVAIDKKIGPYTSMAITCRYLYCPQSVPLVIMTRNFGRYFFAPVCHLQNGSLGGGIRPLTCVQLAAFTVVYRQRLCCLAIDMLGFGTSIEEAAFFTSDIPVVKNGKNGFRCPDCVVALERLILSTG
jgi:hypothetical protein